MHHKDKIMSVSSFLLLIGLCLFMSNTTYNPPQPNPNVHFDYFTFSQQWSRGLCMDSQVLPSSFTIHGLWPSNYATDGPTYCINNFAWRNIQRLENSLKPSWPNVVLRSRHTNRGFWRYQWNRHGSCTTFTQFNYFSHAMNLRSRYNIKSILASQGIRARRIGISYRVSLIVAAIKTHTSVEPRVVCVFDGYHTYVSEIQLCFEAPTASILIDCPYPRNKNCGEFAIF